MTAFRLVEAAEAVLHDRLGIREHTFGRTPRVHVSCDFHRELRFYDPVAVTLSVTRVGRASARYAFALTVAGEDDGPAADGEMVIVHVEGSGGRSRSTPWPPEVRERLLGGGDQGRIDAT